MKGLRTPILLLAALLVLGGVAYWDDWKTQKEEGTKKTEKKLFTFEDKDVTALDFFHKDEKDGDVSLRFEKRDDHWFITKPVEAKAADEAVRDLIKNMREYQYERVAAETKDRWKDFGLENPQAKITVHTPTGEQTLLLGIKAPVGYSVYVATGKDDKVYLGSQYIDMAANKKIFDFRDKSFVTIKTDDLAKLTFTKTGEKPVVIAREGDKWTITAPQNLAADPDEITAFVNSLNAERVEAFFDQPNDDLKKALNGQGKDAKVLAKLNWETKDGTKRDVTFAKKGAELFANEASSPLIVKLPEGAATKLNKTSADFRFRKVFAFDPLAAKALTIDGATYEKKDGKWMRTGQAEPADHVGALLADLSQAKTDRFEDLAGQFAQTLGSPKHSLILQLDDPQLSKVEVSVWPDKKDETKLYLKHTAGQYLYRIDAKALAHLTPQSSAQTPALDEMPDDGHDHG